MPSSLINQPIVPHNLLALALRHGRLFELVYSPCREHYHHFEGSAADDPLGQLIQMSISAHAITS
jgi:hypothetical protein